MGGLEFLAPVVWKQDKGGSWDGGQTEPLPRHLQQGWAPVSSWIIHSRGFSSHMQKDSLQSHGKPGMSAGSTCGVDVPLLLSLHGNMEGGNILLGSLLLLYAGPGYGQSLRVDTLRDTLGTFVTTLEAFETPRDILGTLGTP